MSLTALVLGLVGCASTAVRLGHEPARYGAMSVAQFADSLGGEAHPSPDPKLRALSVKSLSAHPDVTHQLAVYFQEWCRAHRSEVWNGEQPKQFRAAADEYRKQLAATGPDRSGMASTCETPEKELIGGWLSIEGPNEQLVAFYDGTGVKTFTKTFMAAAQTRAETDARRANRELEAARAKNELEDAEERAVVEKSGVGGPSIQETVAAIEQIQRDDPMSSFAGLRYRKPCKLAFGEKIELELSSLRLAKLENARTLTTNVGSEHTTFILDVEDGKQGQEVRFESPVHASRMSRALSHLGELCGAKRAAF